MSERNPNGSQDRANTIGMVLSLLAGIVWVVYGMTGTQQWLLVLAVVLSMLVGGWWAFGRQLLRGGRR